MYIFVRLFQGRIIFFLETKRSAQSNALYWQFYVVPITCFGTCCGTWEKLYLDTSPGIGNVHYKKLPCPQIQKKRKKSLASATDKSSTSVFPQFSRKKRQTTISEYYVSLQQITISYLLDNRYPKLLVDKTVHQIFDYQLREVEQFVFLQHAIIIIMQNPTHKNTSSVRTKTFASMTANTQ